MIVSKDHFDPKIEKIKALLFDEKKPLEIVLTKPRSNDYYSKEYYREQYAHNFIEFPVNVVPADHLTQLNIRLVISFNRYHQIDSAVADDKQVVDNAMNSDGSSAIWDIDEILDDKIHSMFYEFDKSLEAAKLAPWCLGISDNVLIIKNLLSHYITIRNTPDLMISFFYGLTLGKDIADLLLDIYIEFLSGKLEMLTIEKVGISNISSPVSGMEYKIKWKGKQADIVELFVELERKNWIEPLEQTSLAQSARTICKSFDLSATKRKKDADVVQSINQLLKGEYNEKKVREYVFDKKGNDRKFHNIIQN